eukprot:SAG22_NODE_9251_length_600_cov_1.624750_1_plen_193_part_10
MRKTATPRICVNRSIRSTLPLHRNRCIAPCIVCLCTAAFVPLAHMDAHEDPDPGDGAQPGWSGAVLLRMAQLDVATLDAGLELVTYRLVAVFGAMASADMGSMNARRAVVGTATATGTALLLLRACTAGSACATLAHFAYVLVMPATLQSMLIVHHLQLGINITAGQWVWYGTLVVAAATWAAARALCDGELR